MHRLSEGIWLLCVYSCPQYSQRCFPVVSIKKQRKRNSPKQHELKSDLTLTSTYSDIDKRNRSFKKTPCVKNTIWCVFKEEHTIQISIIDQIDHPKTDLQQYFLVYNHKRRYVKLNNPSILTQVATFHL